MFSNPIIIYGNSYKLKSCIFYIGNNHYTIIVLNNECKFLDLEENKTYYHDGLSNNGYITEIVTNFGDIINNKFPYIIILNKNNNQ